MTPLARRLLRFGAPVALVAAGALSSAALAQDDHAEAPETDTSGLEAERERVQDEQARVAGEVDLLVADEADVAAALAVLDRALVEQQAALVAARQAAVAAQAQLDEAIRLEREAEAAVEAAEARLRELAVSAYVRPPDEALIPAVAGGTVEEAPVRIVYAEVRARQLQDAIDAIAATERELARRRRAQEAAQQAAAAAEAEAAAKLGELESARAAQSDAAQQVAERLERALAESASLVALDSQLAGEIAARQAVLAAAAAESQRAAAEVAAADVALAQAAPPQAPAAPSGAGPSGPPAVLSDEPAPVVPPPPPTPAPAPAPATPRPLPTPVQTTWVGGIEVSVEIAAQVQALLDAAAADGLALTGSGYRNIEDQILIRSEVCGPTDYDIWEKPSWECVPPVARPGRSMHEKGLAIDFTGPSGDLVRTQDSPTFQWLAVNAARFGLYNLPSEPWHWSTTGG